MPHIHEKIDYTVEVFVVHKDRVLLRVHDKYGHWLSVGGHVELHEDPHEAALREVKEEVGLDVVLYDGRHSKEEREHYRELIPPMGLNRHRINDAHEHVCMNYFAISDTMDASNQEKEESPEMRWFSRDELESGAHTEEYALKDNVRFWALKALEVLGE